MKSVPVLALSGTVGVGKTTVLVEIHDILSTRKVPHACVERDALAYSWPTRGYFNQGMAIENLASVWANYSRAGAECLVVAGVVEREADLEGYRRAVPGAEIRVCHLTASEYVRIERLKSREPGSGREWHLKRTVELARLIETSRLNAFTVLNDGRPVRDVALEVLTMAAWFDDRREVPE